MKHNTFLLKGGKRPKQAFRFGVLLLLSLTILIPLLYLFVCAFISPQAASQLRQHSRFVPGNAADVALAFSAESFTTLFREQTNFWAMYANSLFNTSLSVLGQFVVAVPAAWALSVLGRRGHTKLFYLYIIMMLLPFQLTMVPNYIVLNKLGLLNTPAALILPCVFSALPVFIAKRCFDEIGQDALEAAALDGAGFFAVFFKIALPLGRTGVGAALILGFFESWNDLERPMLFLQDKKLWPVSLYFPTIEAEHIGVAMAASLLILLPPLLVFLLSRKQLEQGLETGYKIKN